MILARSKSFVSMLSDMVFRGHGATLAASTKIAVPNFNKPSAPCFHGIISRLRRWFGCRQRLVQARLDPPGITGFAHHTVLYTGLVVYMNREVVNHKTDPTMLAELQKATKIAEQHLTDFYPGMDDARSRLQWASGRRTTRPEDIAYSLFGIFKVYLPVLYGESAENALGHLLAEIISQSGDVSILDWVGEASSFHSCFPSKLAPYKTVPHVPLIPGDTGRCDGLELEKARRLYDTLATLPRAQFLNRRLTLPSIVHWVTVVKLLRRSTKPPRLIYEIRASHLRPLEIALSIDLEKTPGPYVLIRPWHPKSFEAQADSDTDTIYKMLEHLQQPFNSLLLRRLPRNEYQRISSDCAIIACVQDLGSILDSEILIPAIV